MGLAIFRPVNVDELGPVRPPRAVVRTSAGMHAFEQTLRRRGFTRLAGVDEAGRGACAGPLVAAAVILPVGVQIEGVADSKTLTAQTRERLYDEIVEVAESWSVVVIPPADVDKRGLHVCNVLALRQAVWRLGARPDYVFTDGFPVDGLPSPALAVWKGDTIVSCVAAASIVAKVTRDRMMTALDAQYPQYEFARHKGYITAAHSQALERHGPCPQHRFRYVNVARALQSAAAAGEPFTRAATETSSASGTPDFSDEANRCGDELRVVCPD